ncbi:MAG: hypothetical protein GQ570_02855 [Helicobacteraceae bacterium]|nr:hypothetical protein [Helicobacteraceae bacterium]
MYLLLPFSGVDSENSALVELINVKSWALAYVDEGKLQTIKFFNTREEIEEMVDIIVVTNDQEYVWPFMEQHITVLVAHTQRSLVDIIEAFIFKELHELAS